jgi:hypothetical protein
MESPGKNESQKKARERARESKAISCVITDHVIDPLRKAVGGTPFFAFLPVLGSYLSHAVAHLPCILEVDSGERRRHVI